MRNGKPMGFGLLAMAVLSCLLLGVSLLWVSGEVKSGEPAKVDENLPLLLRLGKEVRPITFVDTKGKKWQLHDEKNAKANVVVFLNFQCPISNRYVSVLNSFAEKYSNQGVLFAGVVCDVESAEELDRHSREFVVNFKLYYDPQHLVAKHFLAETTPQCFLMDSGKMLRYTGAIDDQYQDRTTRLKTVKTPYLANAIEKVLANKPVELQLTQAFGCALTKVEKEEIPGADVTFYKDLLPLLQKHCQRCHRPGEVAPFQLMTFDDAQG